MRREPYGLKSKGRGVIGSENGSERQDRELGGGRRERKHKRMAADSSSQCSGRRLCPCFMVALSRDGRRSELYFFLLFWLCLRCAEVPRPEIKAEPQQWQC